MTQALAKRRAKDNPLSGGAMAALIVGGIVVVGGVAYLALRPKATAAAKVATTPTTQLTPGANYVFSGLIGGLDLAGNQIGAFTPFTEAAWVAILGTLGWSNVVMLWWGPTATINDPNGYLSLPRISAAKFAGTFIVTCTWTGAAGTLPAVGMTAYKIG